MMGQLKTVDQVLAPLTKAIKGLETVNKQRIASADAKEVEIAQLTAEAAADRKEAARANVVLGKLNALISDDAADASEADVSEIKG